MPKKNYFFDAEAKIYVAGHRGLVGSAIVRALRERGFGNILTRTHKELELTDQRAVADFFVHEKPAYVFLAAAKVGGIHANNVYRAEFIYQNLMVQTNVIHQSWLHGVKRLLFLGSSCIYPRLCPQPMREEHLMTGPLEETNSPYALAKIAGIETCWSYNRQYGTDFIPVMPTNLYGPNDTFDLENSHVLPALIRKFHLARLASEGNWDAIARDEKKYGPIPESVKDALDFGSGPGPRKVVVWGTGQPRREFLHVDDMADACLFLMEQPPGKLVEACGQGNALKPLFNIGTGSDVTIRELAGIVGMITGFPGEIVFDDTRPDGTPRKLLDVSRLHSLGWRARIALEAGVRTTYQWYCSE